MLTPQRLRQRKQQLVDAVEDLRLQILDEERRLSRDSSTYCTIFHLALNDTAVFKHTDIFVFGADDIGDLNSLLTELSSRCKSNMVELPQLWELIRLFLDGKKDSPFVSIKEIETKFPNEGYVIILRYMHNDGRILWFERHDKLRDIVFHRLSAIADSFSLLFHHRHMSQWQARIESSTGFYVHGKWTTAAKHVELIKHFLSTGVLDEAVLMNLYANHILPTEIALTLLQSFYLVCGPVKTRPRSTYIIPFLSPECLGFPSLPPKYIQLRSRIRFFGLSPPTYVYHLLTVSFLRLFSSPTSVVKAGKNGATVSQGQLVISVLHGSKERSITVQIGTPLNRLGSGWKLLIDVLEQMLSKLKSVWSATQFSCEFLCAHCLYLKKCNPSRDIEPDKEIDPDWYTPPCHTDTDYPLNERLTTFNGVEPVACRNDEREDGIFTVPQPLRFPCELKLIFQATFDAVFCIHSLIELL